MRNKFLLFFSMMLLFVGKMSAQDTFTQITTLDQLTSGEYLIVGDGSANDGILLNQTDASGHNTFIKHTAIDNPASEIVDGYTDGNVFTITLTGENLTIFNASVGYVTYRGNNNHASFFNGEVTNQERWTATVNGEGLWFLNNVAAPTRILQWNNSAPRFAAYTSNQVKLKLYKKVETEEPTSYTIEVTQAEGGSVSPEGTIEVEEGGSATFTATPSSICYSFSHWIVNGEEAGNENPYTFSNVTENQTISAVFTMVPDFSITAIAGENGTISPSGEIFAACGSEATFIITPNAGFEIADVLVNGESVGAVSTYTIEDIMADYTIEASFVESEIEPSEECVSEDFSSIPNGGSSYADRTWTGNNGVEWSATDSRTDQTINGKAITLRASTLKNVNSIENGVGTLSFNYKRAFTNNSTLKVFVNGIQYGGNISVSSETPVLFTVDVNVVGPVIVELVNTGNRTAIDDLTWTCYAETPCETPVPTAEAQEFCAGAKVADLVAEGTEIKWYASADSIEALDGTEELVSGSYFVTQTIEGCESEKLEVEVIVNEMVALPTSEDQTFCGTATIADLVAEGTEIKWYDSIDAVEALEGTTELVSGTYFVSQTIGICESGRLEVNVTINEIPAAPIAVSPQIFTEGQTLADLVVEGENLTWYDAEGNVLEATTVLVGGTTYYVSQTVNGCESETTAITVELEGETGDACFEEGFEGLTEIATGSQYAAGSYTNNGVTWDFFGQSPIGANGNNYTIDGQGILLRRASDGYLQAIIPAGVATFSFDYRKAYTSGAARQLEFIVDGELLATTPEFGAGSGDNTTVYTFSYDVNTTAPALVKIKLSGTADTNRHATIDNISWTCDEVVPCETPAPTAEDQTFCEGATVADLVAEGTEIKWYASLESTEVLALTELLEAGSYFATQTIEGCESEKTEVIVTLLETPEAPIAESPQTFTEGQTLADLVVEGENLTWYDAEGNELPETTVLVDGTTYFVTSSNELCESAQTEILVQLEGIVEEPCFEEGFDNLTEIATGTQYAEGSYTNNGITWNFFGQSPIGANGGDYSIDGQGILLRRASDGFLEATLPAGVGVFSFEYRKAYTGGNARQLELIVNGTSVATTEIFGNTSGEDTTVYTFSYELNTEESTLVRIKLTGEEITNRHVTIDNISWTCTGENPCDVPAPIAVSPQQFTAGQTLADLIVEGVNLTWYDADGNVLPETTVLVDGETYFVTQTIDGCESDATSIEVFIEDLGNGLINIATFAYYPNPVKDKLSIVNTTDISEVMIYNLAGAMVMKQNTSAKSVELNLSNVSTGTYIVKVVTGNEVKTFKIIKK